MVFRPLKMGPTIASNLRSNLVYVERTGERKLKPLKETNLFMSDQ